MTSLKEWNDLTLFRKLRVFPNRHSPPVKCVLYLMFNVTTKVSWESAHKLLEGMGYVPIVDEEDLGGGMVRITKGWTRP